MATDWAKRKAGSFEGWVRLPWRRRTSANQELLERLHGVIFLGLETGARFAVTLCLTVSRFQDSKDSGTDMHCGIHVCRFFDRHLLNFGTSLDLGQAARLP